MLERANNVLRFNVTATIEVRPNNYRRVTGHMCNQRRKRGQTNNKMGCSHATRELVQFLR